jgi:hypothetical protein
MTLKVRIHFTDTTKVYNDSYIEDIRCSENLTNSSIDIEPGICEQYAEITLYDRDGDIHDRASSGTLAKKQKVEILIEDGESIGTYFTTEWNVPGESSSITITCSDPSTTFGDIQIESAGIKTRTVDDLLTLTFEQIKSVVWQYIDTDTQAYCESIRVPNSWYYASSAKSTLNKICSLGMLRIYWYIDRFIVARCY